MPYHLDDKNKWSDPAYSHVESSLQILTHTITTNQLNNCTWSVIVEFKQIQFQSSSSPHYSPINSISIGLLQIYRLIPNNGNHWISSKLSNRYWYIQYRTHRICNGGSAWKLKLMSMARDCRFECVNHLKGRCNLETMEHGYVEMADGRNQGDVRQNVNCLHRSVAVRLRRCSHQTRSRVKAAPVTITATTTAAATTAAATTTTINSFQHFIISYNSLLLILL